MKEPIITYLNGKLELLNYFNRIYCLCERIKQGEETYPAHYLGQGQYEMVSDFDKNDGAIFWLSDGPETLRVNDNNSTSCRVLYDITIPLKCYAVVRKNKTTDDEYTNDRIADTLSQTITSNNAALKVTLKSKKVQVTVESKNTNRDNILSSLYEGIDFKLPYEYSIVEIGVNALVTTENNCIPNICLDE